MTAMQKAFVGFYLADPTHNASEAARKAGCNPNSAAVTASKWLKSDKIRTAIDKAMGAREKRTAIDADYILTAAKDVLEMSLSREPVLVRQGRAIVQEQAQMRCDCADPNCKGTRTVGVWKFDSAGANGALKLLAAHVRGFHAPRTTELAGQDGQPINVQLVQYDKKPRGKK